jgi:hypothetical protein
VRKCQKRSITVRHGFIASAYMTDIGYRAAQLQLAIYTSHRLMRILSLMEDMHDLTLWLAFGVPCQIVWFILVVQPSLIQLNKSVPHMTDRLRVCMYWWYTFGTSICNPTLIVEFMYIAYIIIMTYNARYPKQAFISDCPFVRWIRLCYIFNRLM